MAEDYKNSLNLPKTEFPMRAGLAQKEPQLLEKWNKENLYQKLIKSRDGKPIYTLHDGPPYANGHLHHGHVLNKVLKDIIVRSRTMSGFQTEFVPGWDCHGLPIEIQVDRDLGQKKHSMDPVEFRRECRAYAEKYIKIQKDEFIRLGCIGDWDHPYLTMNYNYEAAITHEFAKFVERGSVYRGRKPVYWCTECNGPLAEFEVEYADHESYSIYVKFEVMDDLRAKLPPEVRKEKNIFIVIWTTTPWTLPANLAIALGPQIKYVAAKNKANGEVYIVADDLLESFAKACRINSYEVIGKVEPKPLELTNTKHPFIDRKSMIILADYVTLDSGTGCVHTAPGHGMEDYISGIRYGLEILTPVDGVGNFTKEAVAEWEGKSIWQSNVPIMEMLKKKNVLLNEVGEKITHSYPHCWRHKTPLLFRATDQWFVSMENNSLRKKALEDIRKVTWIPSWGEERIYGMVQNRPDWCISRQRLWGMPIVAFHCKQCGEILLDAKIVNHVADIFEKEGADAWFAKKPEELLPKGTTCKKCGSVNFNKDNAILDVWFDSGVSYAADVGLRHKERIPVDLYIEGSDQHRGWFQSALLCGVGARDHVPYKQVITHGFVVDAEGKAYSKSRILEAQKKGLKIDYLPPEDVVKVHGAELLRLWTASEDYRYDITFSEEVLKVLSESYRKLRNTLRFMLGNLYDFDPAQDKVPVSELMPVDRFALGRFYRLVDKLRKSYDDYEFHPVYHHIMDFSASFLSSVYLDLLKDRLYASGAKWNERKSAQTVIYTMCDGIIRLMAPILVFTSEEAWGHLPKPAGEPESVHFADFPAPDPKWLNNAFMEEWEELILVRDEVLKALETARKELNFGQSLLAKIVLGAEEKTLELLKKNEKYLPELFIVSQVELKKGALEKAATSEKVKNLTIKVELADGKKCSRCWNVLKSVGSDAKHPELCERCAKAVSS